MPILLCGSLFIKDTFTTLFWHLFKKWFMLRYLEFNVLNFKAWNPDPSNSVFVCVQWVVCGWVRGGHSVHPPPFMLRGGGWTSNQIFKKGWLDRTSTFRGGFLREREWLFSGGLQFSHKNKLKLKSDIFNGKIVYKQKYSSLS